MGCPYAFNCPCYTASDCEGVDRKPNYAICIPKLIGAYHHVKGDETTNTVTIPYKEYENIKGRLDYLWALEVQRTEDAIHKVQSQYRCSCADGTMGKKATEPTIEQVLKNLNDIHHIAGIAQSVYVIEECSELTKALSKGSRGKGSEEDVLAEACDVITAVFGFLMDHGVSREYVKDQILYKCNRAIERYYKNGEL